MVQFGIPGDPAKATEWRAKRIPDDKVTQSNTKGMVTFATAGPNTRTSQIFINYGNNQFLDSQGFSPFGKVVEGMDIVEKIESKHGESPDQGRIQSQGNAYLMKSFPELDYIKKATVIE
jgi:peptidyl-prolyl cis-trans isomerase A (cyclophilin A)